jgi:hypothetical protein
LRSAENKGRQESKGRVKPAILNPAALKSGEDPVARAELSTPPGQKSYFFFAFLAFFAFFAFFAFLAIVSSQGFNGLKRDTRGMLGGGPASQYPQD